MKDRSYLFLVFLFAFACGFGAHRLYAAEYTSTHFIVKDSVINGIAGYASSPSFQLFSSGDFVLTGRTPSSGSFLGHFGFLYFPFVTAPSVSATPADAQVGLSWGASTAGLGFSVSGYEVGQSTTSGGPYTFVNIGNTLSSTRTGLTNGTPYYFVIRVLDAFGTPIITSSEVSATPNGSVTPPPVTTSGGGQSIGVQFSGLAYPNATVSILKDGVDRAKAHADVSGAFTTTLEEIFNNSILYTLYATDVDGNRSLLLNYPLLSSAGRLSRITGIRFAPTIDTDKIAVKTGNDISFFGFGLPSTPLEFLVDGPLSKALTVSSGADGRYRFDLSTTGFPPGEYGLRVHYPNDIRMSTVIQFTVGAVDILKTKLTDIIPGDCNTDNTIDLRDFSILAFWYQKPHPPACIDTNHDGVVNLVDFSILAFYWTG